MTLEESKNMIQSYIELYGDMRKGIHEVPIPTPEFFDVLKLAYKALEEVPKISYALLDIAKFGGPMYGHSTELKIAEEWFKTEKGNPHEVDIDFADGREGED